MRCMVFLENGQQSNERVVIFDTKVQKGGSVSRFALAGGNVEKASTFLSSIMNVAPWFAANIIRWRARNGYVMTGVL